MASYTTKAPSGMKFTRKGNAVILEWKISDADYDGGQYVYRKIWFWKKVKQTVKKGKKTVTKYVGKSNARKSEQYVNSKATSFTTTINPKSYFPYTKMYLTKIECALQGCRAVFDEGYYTYYPSWSAKTSLTKEVLIPRKPVVTASLSRDYDNLTTFSWAEIDDNKSFRWFSDFERQTVLIENCNEKDGSKVNWSGAKSITGPSKSPHNITEDSAIFQGNYSFTRWYRVRCRGPRGASEWKYAKHVYAIPAYAQNVKSAVEAGDAARGYYRINVKWTAVDTNAHPIDTTTIEYSSVTPDINVTILTDEAGTQYSHAELVPPVMSGGTSVGVTKDTSGEDGMVFSVPTTSEFDRCIVVRVNTQHDSNTAIGETTYVSGSFGNLAEPTIRSIGTVVPETRRVSIQATNNSQVPNTHLAICYKTESEPDKEYVIGIIPYGKDEATVILPESCLTEGYSIGVFARCGDYSPLRPNATEPTYYSLTNDLIFSNKVWGEGAVPKPPQAVTLTSPSFGVIRASWDWSWLDATGAELSWSSHEDAWESTDEPTTYIVNNTNASAWNIRGLDVGTWYVRVRLFKSSGESMIYGSYSETATIKLSAAPSIPSLTLSDSIITEEGQVTCYWAYVTNDGTAQQQADVCEAFKQEDGSFVYGDPIARASTMSYVTIMASDNNWKAGETHYLSVRVTSASGETSEDWSTPVALTIANKIDITVRSTSLVEVTETIEDGDEEVTSTYNVLENLPLAVDFGFLDPYKLSTDPTVIDGKSYYVKVDDEYISPDPFVADPSPYYEKTVTPLSHDPSSFGYYEVDPEDNLAYILTEDTSWDYTKIYYERSTAYRITEDLELVEGKTYYSRSGEGTEDEPYVYTSVEEPVVEEIATYYEQYYVYTAVPAPPAVEISYELTSDTVWDDTKQYYFRTDDPSKMPVEEDSVVTTTKSGDIVTIDDAKPDQSFVAIKSNFDPIQSGTPWQSPAESVPYLFRQSSGGAVDHDYFNELDSLVGGTVAWNQLVKNGNFATTDGWTVFSGTVTKSVSNNVMTLAISSSSFSVAKYVNCPNGHIVFCKMEAKASAENKAKFNFWGSEIHTSWTTLEAFLRNTDTAVLMGVYNGGLDSTDSTVQLRNFELFDLTQMFGSTIADYVYSLEQTTAGAGVAWLKAHGFLTKDYYAYNESSLLSVKTSEHRTVGFNALNPNADKIKGDYNLAVGAVLPSTSPTASASGTNPISVVVGNAWDMVTFISDELVANNTYTADYKITGSADNSKVRGTAYLIDDTYTVVEKIRVIQGSSGLKYTDVFTPSKTGLKFALAVSSSPAQTLTIEGLCVHLGEGNYEPYHINSYPLDSDLELRGIPKLSNGSLYYDGDVYESSGAVTRKYGIVDLGTLNYYYDSGISSMTTSTPLSFKKPTTNAEVVNAITPIAKTISADNRAADTVSRLYAFYNNDSLYFRDTGYTDAQAFKTAMSGVYLVYELATPTTEQADPYASPQVVNPLGTEEYIDTRDVPVPVGHRTNYAEIYPISGWDEVKVTRTGINVWDEEWEVGGISSTTGANTGNTDRIRSKNYIPVVPNTTYYAQAEGTIALYFYDDSNHFVSFESGESRAFTTGENVHYLRFVKTSTTTYNHDICINYPSTDTDYHAYNGATYTIDLDGTRYGGTLDVTSGVLKYCPYYASYNGETLTGEWISDRDVYVPNASPSIGAQVVNIGGTLTTVQLTQHQIDVLLGINNVWADSGDVSVRYLSQHGYLSTPKPIESPMSLGYYEYQDVEGRATLTIERAESYHIDRPDESEFDGFEGETISMIDQVNGGTAYFEDTDITGLLDDGAKYRLLVNVVDTYGQRAEAEPIEFIVRWAHQAVMPEAEVEVFKDDIYTTILPIAPSGYELTRDTTVVEDKKYFIRSGEGTEESPYIYTEVSEPSGDPHDLGYYQLYDYSEDRCNIYRLSVDSPQLIVEDAEFGTKYVDPYPTLKSFGGYRLSYRTINCDYITEDNKLAWTDYTDPEEHQVDRFLTIIDFDKDRVILPYDLELSNKWSKDFTETKYLGGSIQGDWNPAVSRTGSVRTTTIVFEDPDTVRAMRRLATYPGICHIRTPDGSNYSANIDVSEDRENKMIGQLAKFSIDITRVDPDELDGRTYASWESENE